MTRVMPVAWLVATYLLFTMVIGVAAGSLVHGARDFFTASRRLPLLLSSFALFALWFGSETLFGASAEFLSHGLLGVIEDPFGGFLCLVLFALLLVRPLYRRNLLTLGDLFRSGYGPHTETLAAFCMILTFVGYIAGQLIALSLLFANVFGLEPEPGLLLGALIVTLYTASGGLWAVSLTDFIQSIVIIAGLLVVCVSLGAQADLAALRTPPAPHYFDFLPSSANGMRWSDYLAAWLTLGLGSLASQDIFQRANAARSEGIAVYSTLLGAALYLLCAMLPLFLALLVHQLQPQLLAEGARQAVLIRLVQLEAPVWLQGLFFGALISAVFSTCSGALLAPASIMAENLIKPLFLKRSDDATLLPVVRSCVVVMALLAVALSFSGNSIYELVAASSMLGAVSILVPMLFALFDWPRSPLGAWLSMLGGLASYAICEYATWVSLPPLFGGLAASLVGMALGLWLRPVTPVERRPAAGERP
ncbi:MAG: sodium:solute symporter family protein [Pseudohongiellaceae bacterium]